ncbi:hypothetical protein AYL99_06189 [Fonsecaea erecta]|uniref:Protein kinase domain-containing protein n=1 Tax=Fonsecaea erecta TaxID=1367422 RepID=A0A178ZGX6_9EURO|nr:hypothetical protein AYL99_06189 [Fonsecaea erecta]OAP58892.1 hypothetical protein AYL99_06189 [Fonsecaea erecta]
MAIAQRPSPLNRTTSTPPTTPNTPSNTESKLQHTYANSSILTPPTSPRQSRSSSNISELATPISAPVTPSPAGSTWKSKEARLDPIKTDAVGQSISPETSVPECPFDVEILKDECGRDAVFGTGAWSTVFKATTHPKPRTVSGSLTPPLSPAFATPVLVAVKKPARRDAVSILKSEANVLTYLHTIPNSDSYVVPFYGTVDHTSLVLEAIPFSLGDHIRQCAAVAAQNVSTWTMTDPVLGSSAKWFHLARQLISALVWLHNDARVVHGDIKPGNILLTRVQGSGTDISFQPIFADFSSAQRLDTEDTTTNTLSAITREYTAPELLNSKVLRDPTSTATPASDVFSMAITLLVAATGQMLVYPGSVFQRQAMATQGWMVLNYARNSEQGSRVPRFGLVERVLERAVLKADLGRVSAQEWLGIVETIAQGDPVKL